MSDESGNDSRDGVALTNLDQPLFDGADATKRDLVEYLDAVRDRIIPELEDRPLSVIRVHRGQEAFMQKNVPKYTPSWVPTARIWAETSKREVSYALCNDRRTLLWFANQRAVEYHPTLVRAERPDRVTHLVLDLDPPDNDAFSMGVRVAHLVRARWPTSDCVVRSRPAGPRVCTCSSRSTTRRHRRIPPRRREPSRRASSVSIPRSPRPRS